MKDTGVQMKHEHRYLRYKRIIEKYLQEFIVDKLPHSLYTPAKYVLSSGGKRLRPIITLLACEATGGKTDDAIHASAGIEILHNFTLVHDDIMDCAKTRRGRLTVHQKWDENVAILAGDALLGLAYKALLKTKSQHIQNICRIFTEGIITVCEGQALDKEFETRQRVHINDYLFMVEKKTGKLVSIAAEIGALIGNGTTNEVIALGKFGMNLGRAFQIQDDLLDIMGNEQKFGKSIGNDLMQGKKTFILLEALRHAMGKQKQLLTKAFKKGAIKKSDINAFRKIFEDTGAIEITKKKIENDIMEAKNQLSILKASPARETLLWLADKLLNRTY